MDSIRSGTAGARSTAYDAAYSMPIDYASPAGAKLLDEVSPRLPGSAIKYANDLMKLKHPGNSPGRSWPASPMTAW
jgi:hypothetical protein